jgi:hypothetical protein
MSRYIRKRMLGQNTKSARYLQHKVAQRHLHLHLPLLKGKHYFHRKFPEIFRKVHQENKIIRIASETYTNENLRGQEFSTKAVLHPDFKVCKCKFGQLSMIISSSHHIF